MEGSVSRPKLAPGKNWLWQSTTDTFTANFAQSSKQIDFIMHLQLT